MSTEAPSSDAPDLLRETRVVHGQNVMWLCINREQRRNAMSAEVLAGLSQAFDDAQADRSIKAMVLTGAGSKAFCAGADLQTSNTFVQDYSEPYAKLANVFRKAKQSTVPTIARVNGACMAGGMGLLAMCDMAVAAPHAVFGLPEVKVGVFPAQVLAVLQHQLPRRVLTELCITGEPVSAQQALAMNLVNHVGEVAAGADATADAAGQVGASMAALDAKLDWLLARLLDKSPAAIRRGLYMLKKLETMGFEESISFAESQIALFTLSEDAKEGQAAFQQKRQANWVGR
jgi:enoyl-CoA hydratase/carnithine racemase